MYLPACRSSSCHLCLVDYTLAAAGLFSGLEEWEVGGIQTGHSGVGGDETNSSLIIENHYSRLSAETNVFPP